MRAEDSSLWNDAQEAQKLMRERQTLEDGVKAVRNLLHQTGTPAPTAL